MPPASATRVGIKNSPPNTRPEVDSPHACSGGRMRGMVQTSVSCQYAAPAVILRHNSSRFQHVPLALMQGEGLPDGEGICERQARRRVRRGTHRRRHQGLGGRAGAQPHHHPQPPAAGDSGGTAENCLENCRTKQQLQRVQRLQVTILRVDASLYWGPARFCSLVDAAGPGYTWGRHRQAGS